MTRVIVVDPDAHVRESLRSRHLALGAALALSRTIEEAQELSQQAARSIVVARNLGGPEAAAAAACGFDLAAGPSFVRLILACAPSSTRFIHEVERIVAELSLPAGPEADAGTVDSLPDEFPHVSYVPLARVGRARCAEILLVRNRIVGARELLVQVDEDPRGASEVAGAVYRSFAARAEVPARLLRHELTRDHSYIAAGPLPMEFAREVDGYRGGRAA